MSHFCFLFPWTGLSGEDQVEQSPQTLRVQEGDSVSLTCSYRVSNFRGLQWYRQDPGKGPKHLFLLYSVGKGDQKGRLSVSLSQKESSLNITAPKAEDSATYLCAVEPQCSPGTCSLHQNPGIRALGCFPPRWGIYLAPRTAFQVVLWRMKSCDTARWQRVLCILPRHPGPLCVPMGQSAFHSSPESPSQGRRWHSCDMDSLGYST